MWFYSASSSLQINPRTQPLMFIEHSGNNRYFTQEKYCNVFSVEAITAVTPRLYYHRLNRVKLGSDDFCILPTLASPASYFAKKPLNGLQFEIGLRGGHGDHENHQ